MAYDIIFAFFWIVSLYLLADFIAGLFHWAEDTLGTTETPIWGKLFVAPNVRHHELPLEMNKIHWFRNSLPIYAICASVLVIAWLNGGPSWQIWYLAFVGLFAQQTHRWSHTPRKALPGPVIFLQRIGILQRGKHHYLHHRDEFNTHFCVGTPWVNPVLDRLKFWLLLERLFVPIFGAPRRPDLKKYGWYRGTAIWN